MLLTHWRDLCASWRPCFPQQRTHLRAVRQGLGGLLCLGRRTLWRIIWTSGGEQRGWSGEYFLHSRCRGRPQRLFAPIRKRALPLFRGRLAGMAIDETRLRKTGRPRRQAFYQRDPLSPPLHANPILGLRSLRASLLVPLRRDEAIGWRTAKPFHGGQRRKVRCKQAGGVYWQGGARRTPLRLLVVALTPYRQRRSIKLYCRQPAYLLTSAIASKARDLPRIYFDRWRIEVNHREEKDTLGLGQARLWNPPAVPEQPVLAVASRGALLPASLLAFGPSAARPARPCRSGENGPTDLLVWIWSPYCARKPPSTPTF